MAVGPSACAAALRVGRGRAPIPRAGASPVDHSGVTATTSIARASSATARAATQAMTVVRTGAPGWLGGAAAGVQAALFSFALILIPLWVMAAGSEDAVSWGASSGLAARFWLLGFGVPWAVDGTPISLVPLGIPAITALMLVQLARRFGSATVTAGVFTVIAFSGTLALVAAIAWHGVPDAGDRVWRAVLVSAVMATPATAWGLMRQRGMSLAWLDSVPTWLRAGVRLAVAMLAALVVLASLAAAVSTFQHRGVMAESATALNPDAASGVALAALEMLYAPTIVVWVAAWFSGAGYDLAGLHVAPGSDVLSSAPMPLPLMGALPTWTSAGAAPWLVVVLGAVCAYALRKRLGGGVWALAPVGVAAAIVTLVLAAAGRCAWGAMGPGLLASVGPSPWVFGALAAAELAGGAVAIAAALYGLRRLRGATTMTVRSASLATTQERPTRTRAESSPASQSPTAQSPSGTAGSSPE